MRKLGLHIDNLVVESFATAASEGRKGTVMARENTGSCSGDWGVCPNPCDTILAFCTIQGCYNTMVCNTEETACVGRSCQLSCGSCNGTCAVETCGVTCMEFECNDSQPPWCNG
jgi:hypothetical protein